MGRIDHLGTAEEVLILAAVMQETDQGPDGSHYHKREERPRKSLGSRNGIFHLPLYVIRLESGRIDGDRIHVKDRRGEGQGIHPVVRTAHQRHKRRQGYRTAVERCEYRTEFQDSLADLGGIISESAKHLDTRRDGFFGNEESGILRISQFERGAPAHLVTYQYRIPFQTGRKGRLLRQDSSAGEHRKGSYYQKSFHSLRYALFLKNDISSLT